MKIGFGVPNKRTWRGGCCMWWRGGDECYKGARKVVFRMKDEDMELIKSDLGKKEIFSPRNFFFFFFFFSFPPIYHHSFLLFNKRKGRRRRIFSLSSRLDALQSL